MRVLHIAYQQLRRYGKTRVSWARKLSHGLIKNDHFVEVFSDRDIAAFEAPLGIRDLGVKKANKRLLQTVEAVQPDLVIAGHCDMISDETLVQIRRMQPGVAIVHCNNDPLFVPDNVARIQRRARVCDAVFVSTGKKELQPFEGLGARMYYMPNPVDPSIENLDNSQRSEFPIDLLFCSNAASHSSRLDSVGWLKEQLADSCRFKTYGSFGEPPVWGRDYDRALADSKMGLNLNRQEGQHWYSSARMAQLAGNGILQFTDQANGFETLMPAESLVYYRNRDELLQKVREFHADDARRQHWAARARDFFHREMNNQLNAQYIVEAAMQLKFSHDYVWMRDC